MLDKSLIRFVSTEELRRWLVNKRDGPKVVSVIVKSFCCKKVFGNRESQVF